MSKNPVIALPEPDPLVPLPAQPDGVVWPTDAWPTETATPRAVLAESLVDDLFADADRRGETYAAVIIQGGTVLAQRYGGELPHFDRPYEPVGPETRLLSWSMAKSMVHAAAGILVRQGRFDAGGRAPVALWSAPDDPRHAITIQQLFEMRDGLDFGEVYNLDGRSDVIEMIFGDGKDDTAAFAADRPLAHPPGEFFNYSSGTSAIVARILGDVVGGGETGMRAFLDGELFGRIGMRSAEPRFDPAGTFLGSSYVYATAHDYARFGLLYLRDGMWDGDRILPEGWVDHGRRLRSYDEEDDRYYGAHWWGFGDDLGTFFANGYEGQTIMIVPPLDLIVVRLGKTIEANKPAFNEWRLAARDAFR